MTDLSLQKRLAAEILGVGESRIWIDPERIDEVVDAITREEIKALIKDRVIQVKPVHRNSRERWKIRHIQRKKGRRRGYGKRKGKKTARKDRKEEWMNRIRKIRRFLRYLRDHGVITRKDYRRLYMLAKGGTFHSLASLKRYMKEKGIVKEIR
ncbi:50S ribosomal protein L19e [Staphylothermus hellenicus]|uniref:Large ribosomal subunit protein eL19 n=1 Tax=Staphylothermus hellenicus (strain DSM 12710 / JCM 10830 / BK20S6-10-b1 / P8) TaxID=591019 RepID=D7D9R8_STAHD|nr:50S ribosomal protein L19e [Staphylothermus hellenicus]ADI32514.1 Ribosomal protein L19e [Staphylothermus hellenicus DSM 12710]